MPRVRSPLPALPHADEHAVDLGAPPEDVYAAVPAVLRAGFGRPAAQRVAALLGCDPRTTTGEDRPDVGSTVPGFRVVAAQPPQLLVAADRHRFSRYGLVRRIEPTATGSRLRAETGRSSPARTARCTGSRSSAPAATWS